MRARLVRIGNSRGIRLPKALIEQAGLGEDVDLELQDGAILVRRAGHPRAGWAEAAARSAAANDDALLDAPDVTHFETSEWAW